MIKRIAGFIDANISNESWRSYVYLDEDGNDIEYTIFDPVTLYMKESDTDSHRVVDADGVCHYITKGWVAIRWPAEALEF